MGMTTAQYFIARIKSEGGFSAVTPKETGWLLAVRFSGDSYDTYINVLNDGQFIISLPIGNKLTSAFFPSDERFLLLEYFVSCVEPVDA
jgi:hypothetical protein